MERDECETKSARSSEPIIVKRIMPKVHFLSCKSHLPVFVSVFSIDFLTITCRVMSHLVSHKIKGKEVAFLNSPRQTWRSVVNLADRENGNIVPVHREIHSMIGPIIELPEIINF
jgi:hypothetical protein